MVAGGQYELRSTFVLRNYVASCANVLEGPLVFPHLVGPSFSVVWWAVVSSWRVIVPGLEELLARRATTYGSPGGNSSFHK